MMHEMEETAVLTGFSGVSNDLVHSLQAERGRSVGWLNGHADRKPIEDTRADTDRAQAALNDFIRTAELPAAIRSDLGSLQNDLATLAALRLSVDDKSISPADSLARYTKAIDGLFRFVTVLQQNSSDPVLARDVSAMLGLLCQKEFAGRERAMINGFAFAGSGSCVDTVENLPKLSPTDIGVVAMQYLKHAVGEDFHDRRPAHVRELAMAGRDASTIDQLASSMISQKDGHATVSRDMPAWAYTAGTSLGRFAPINKGYQFVPICPAGQMF